MEDIEAFLIDDIITHDYQLEFNNKLTYYRLEGDIDNVCFSKKCKWNSFIK